MDCLLLTFEGESETVTPVVVTVEALGRLRDMIFYKVARRERESERMRMNKWRNEMGLLSFSRHPFTLYPPLALEFFEVPPSIAVSPPFLHMSFRGTPPPSLLFIPSNLLSKCRPPLHHINDLHDHVPLVRIRR
jgi:hypothetical protein